MASFAPVSAHVDSSQYPVGITLALCEGWDCSNANQTVSYVQGYYGGLEFRAQNQSGAGVLITGYQFFVNGSLLVPSWGLTIQRWPQFSIFAVAFLPQGLYNVTAKAYAVIPSAGIIFPLYSNQLEIRVASK